MQFIGTGDRILTENFVIGYLYTITFKTGIYSNSACIGIGDNFVMFQRAEPDLLFNLNLNTADEVDTIELYDSGGGTNDYDDLVNRPQINSHTLTGNMSGADIGVQNTISDLDTIRAGAEAGATAVQPAALETALAQKQDALSSDQLDAVNSGVTSTDVEQIEKNKNNILLTADQSTQYNIVPIKSTITTGNASVTATVGADKSITIEITGTTSSAIGFEISDNFNVDTNTEYVMTGNPSAGAIRLILQQAESPYNWIGQQYNNQASAVSPSISLVRYYVYIYANSSGTITIKPMLTPKTLWDKGFTQYQPYALSNADLSESVLKLQERFIDCQFIASRTNYAEHTFTVKRSNTIGRYHYGIFMVGTPSTYGIYKIFYDDANTPASATVEKILGNSALTYTASVTWNGLVGTLTLTGSDRAYGGIRGIWFD